MERFFISVVTNFDNFSAPAWRAVDNCNAACFNALNSKSASFCNWAMRALPPERSEILSLAPWPSISSCSYAASRSLPLPYLLSKEFNAAFRSCSAANWTGSASRFDKYEVRSPPISCKFSKFSVNCSIILSSALSLPFIWSSDLRICCSKLSAEISSSSRRFKEWVSTWFNSSTDPSLPIWFSISPNSPLLGDSFVNSSANSESIDISLSAWFNWKVNSWIRVIICWYCR